MLTALLFALVAQTEPRSPTGPIFSGRTGGVAAPFFSFAGTVGTGMGTECAGTTPTGALGETLTFARSSVGTCTVGDTTGIYSNASLVKLSTDAPRVMRGGNGAGVLGLLVEPTSTNSFLRSEEFDNAAWTRLGQGDGATPTVSANAAVAPDGTTTADAVTFGATTTGRSALYQVPNITASGYSMCVFAKGTTGGSSGSYDICTYNGAATTCTTCSYVGTVWTRCTRENVSINNAGSPFIGNSSSDNGGIARVGQTIWLWGAEHKNSKYCDSYIPTTSASVTRAADLGTFSLSLSAGAASVAATWEAPPSASVASNVLLDLYKDASNDTKLSVASSKLRSLFRIGASDSTQDTAGNVTAGAANVAAGYSDGANKAACLGGTCTTASATLTLATGSHVLYLGADQAGANQANGVVKNICVDPSSSRCR